MLVLWSLFAVLVNRFSGAPSVLHKEKKTTEQENTVVSLLNSEHVNFIVCNTAPW